LPLRFSLTFLEESNQWYIRGIEIWASFEDELNIQHIRRIGRTLVTRIVWMQHSMYIKENCSIIF
jgi:hypothetical protein